MQKEKHAERVCGVRGAARGVSWAGGGSRCATRRELKAWILLSCDFAEGNMAPLGETPGGSVCGGAKPRKCPQTCLPKTFTWGLGVGFESWPEATVLEMLMVRTGGSVFTAIN